MKMFCSYLAGLGAIGWSSYIVFMLLNEKNIREVEIFASILVLIPCAAMLYLIYSQKLYSLSESDKIKEQNNIIRMQIEQKKLKEELKRN